MFSLAQEDIPTVSSNNPLCTCTSPVRLGVKMSFWEPIRMVDVVRKPYCFVSLGGLTIDFGIEAPSHAQTTKQEARSPSSFYHVHWYTNPLLFWLEVLMDNGCLEKGVFDVAYVTELDPLWADSETTFIINPDVALFANPIAQAACAADCIAATAGFPTDLLSWCGGCQGSLFPMDGFVGSKVGGVQASSLLLMRFTAKLHRQGQMWAASGSNGLCGFYPQLEIPKSNYKYQMTYPIPETQKINGKCCQPFGRSAVIWGAGKEFPYKGEDFAYQLFRKRDCCAGSLPTSLGGGRP